MKKIILLVLILAAVTAFFTFGGEQYLRPDFYLQVISEQPQLSAVVYFISYVIMAALSLPGAAIMTVLAGALFGLWKGVLLVSFASSIGATLAFLVSRFLLRDWVQARFSSQLERVNRGIEKDGALYLFSLRLIPVIPFFVINLVMGLMPIRTVIFYLVSQIGMLVGTLVYVNAGVQLASLEDLSVAGILTPGLVFAFLLLAILPFIARSIMSYLQRIRVYRNWRRKKPKNFDFNLVVIGAGSAGLVSAYIAATVKAKVALIERHRMGGDCLNTGCVPSKALLRSAKMAHYLQRGPEFGIHGAAGEIRFNEVMDRVHAVIGAIEPHDSVERYGELGVEVVLGEASLVSPWEVRVGDRTITAANIIIATGASPFVPPIPGIRDIGYYTSDTLWDLRDRPEHLLVMGGGPIGCEMVQAFTRLGSHVTLVEALPRIMPREDEDVAAVVAARFVAEGVEVLTKHLVTGFEQDEHGKIAVLASGDDELRVRFDTLLVATGRKANTAIEGLDELGLERNQNETLAVDEYLRTRFPNIYACGDVIAPYQFTHTASHEAWYASVNALFGRLRKFKVDFSAIPWATFTDPEVATVGMNELAATEAGVDYEVTRYDLDELDRAIADGETSGFVKVLTVPAKDRILGVTIVAYHASTVIQEFVLAMRQGIGLNKILGTIHIYPTLTEANKFAAGNWKRAHASEKLLAFSEWLHTRARKDQR